jgi:hypothetical protein
MFKIKSLARKLWKDESAQGTSEYILLLVVVVAIAFLFKTQITKAVGDKLNELAGSITTFKGE